MRRAPESESQPRESLFDRLERSWRRFWGRVSLVFGAVLIVAGASGIVWFGSLYFNAREHGLSICSPDLAPPNIDCGSVPDDWAPFVVIGASLLVGWFGYFLIVTRLRAIRSS